MKASRRPLVGIDFRWLDHLSLGNGQYRYAVDLIRGLAEVCPAMDFLVLGSRPEPVAEVTPIFSKYADSWRYFHIPRLKGRASLYREHWLYARLLHARRMDVLHSLHSFVPLYPAIPVIETVYDLMERIFPDYESTVRSRAYRLHGWARQRFAARVIAISQTTANDLVRLTAFPAERVDVVYLGPEL